MLTGSVLVSRHGRSGPEAWEAGVAAMAEIPLMPTLVGGSLGVFGAALCCLGVLSVFRGLEPAGRSLAWIAAGGLVFWFVMYGAHVGLRPVVAHVLRVEPLALDGLMFSRAVAYMNVQRSMAGLGLFVGSLFFFFTVLFRATAFPRWVAAATPVFYVPGVRLTPWLAAPLAGPWLAGWLELVSLAFFVVVTAVPRRLR
jgi:hypothetical protein